MKFIITESQFNFRIYDKFLNMLVDKTKIYGGDEFQHGKYDYSAEIKLPYADTPYLLSFNNSEEFTYNSPGRHRMNDWFGLIGLDMDESPDLCYDLWVMYLDRLDIKIKDYINDYLN